MITKYKLFESTTDFFDATLNGNFELMKKYLKQGHDINSVDSNGETVMHKILHVDYYDDDIFDFLMKYDDIDFNIQGGDLNDTSLMLAAYWELFGAVKDILNKYGNKIDWTLTNDDGDTFIDELNQSEQKIIKNQYPEQYKIYLKHKKAKDFNL